MGRATYEEMAQAWPASNAPYAAPMNDIPKVVFSKTLDRADWPDAVFESPRFGSASYTAQRSDSRPA